MIRKLLISVLILVVVVVGGGYLWLQGRHEPFPAEDSAVTASHYDPRLTEDIRDRISEQLAAYRAETGVPSLSAAVGIEGRLVYAEATGYADLANEIPATPDSLYRIGSVSKSITAVALGRLMETGQIDIDRAFLDYVPGFPEKRWPFTLRQLASHTAGVRHYRPNFFANLAESYHDVHYEKVADSLVLVADDPLAFEPGTAYQYSSYGYNMLSAAMVYAAGIPFTEQLQSFVFDPSRMPDAQAEDAPDPHPRSVGYYILMRGENYRSPYADNSYKIAGGGIIAAPSELVAFGNALLDGRLIGPETMNELFTPVALNDGTTEPQNYGLGFRNNQREIGGRNYTEVGHGGASVGGLTAFVMYPEVELVIAVTTNVSPMDEGVTPYVPAYAIADLLVPLFDED